MSIRSILPPFACAVLLSASPAALRAQDTMQRAPAGLQQLFTEAVSLPSDETGRARVDVCYRIASEFFVPVRVAEPGATGAFRRRGEFRVDLFDSTDTSVGQRLRQVDIASDSAGADRGGWIGGILSFSVPPGRYTVLAELVDHESRRRVVDRSQTIRAEEFRAGSGAVSTPVFTTLPESSAEGGRLTLQNFGGGILFGSSGGMYVAFSSPDSASLPVEVRYELSVALEEGDDRRSVLLSDTLTDLAPEKRLPLAPTSDADSAWYSLGPAGSRQALGVHVRLPLEKLPLRPYALRVTVRHGEWETSFTRRFRTVWPDMPFSLRDVDVALEALRYITTREVIDSLSSGDLMERWSHLEGFWEPRDRTPGTAFNEVMAEYYHRVDHAMRSFGTLRMPDGFATDRGRIYVVYGPPTRTTRALDPREGFRETWAYSHLKKTFTFVDRTKTGAYVLVSTENQ